MLNSNRGTILVADDDPMIIELFSTTLKNAGWNTIHASNGAEVLEVVDTTHVDALILDLGMPVLDGYDVCLELCNRRSNLPILVITGGNVDMERLNLWNVVRTLQKPIRLDELLDIVEGILPPAIPQNTTENLCPIQP